MSRPHVKAWSVGPAQPLGVSNFAAGLLRLRIFPGYEATYSLLVSLTVPSPNLSTGPSTSRIWQTHPPQRGSPRVSLFFGLHCAEWGH